MSVKQRIRCFLEALPDFLKKQEQHKANRKQGVRTIKNK